MPMSGLTLHLAVCAAHFSEHTVDFSSKITAALPRRPVTVSSRHDGWVVDTAAERKPGQVRLVHKATGKVRTLKYNAPIWSIPGGR